MINNIEELDNYFKEGGGIKLTQCINRQYMSALDGQIRYVIKVRSGRWEFDDGTTLSKPLKTDIKFTRNGFQIFSGQNLIYTYVYVKQHG